MKPPARRVDPLQPPPGAFDDVVRRARAKRYRRLTGITAVAGVFVAGTMSGVATGGSVSAIPGGLVGLANQVVQGPTASATPFASADRTTTTTAATEKPRKHRRTSSPAPTTASAQPREGRPRAALVRGQVVDGSGTAVAGLYVYPGEFDKRGFVPVRAAMTRTGRHGGYTVPCTGGPLLLTPWPLDVALGTSSGGTLSATFVSTPVCTRLAKRQLTVAEAGATIEGHVLTDVGCADRRFRMSLWLDGNRATRVRLSSLREGDAYRISGIPAGTHVLAGKGWRATVTAGEVTLTQDVTFGCPELPSPSASPTSTSPSPIPTPSETVSPSPSPSVTSSGSASPTSSSTPKETKQP